MKNVWMVNCSSLNKTPSLLENRERIREILKHLANAKSSKIHSQLTLLAY
jgi:hypothetical protein